jgi:putative transposase
VSDKQVGTIQIKLNLEGFELAAVVDMCREANSLINSAKYVIRRHFFNSGKPAFVECEYESLDAEMKLLDNQNYRALYSQAAQRILRSVAAEFTSFNGLMKRFFQGEGERPSLPGYRKKGGLAPVTYPAQNLEFDLETGRVKLPLGKLVQSETKEMLPELWIPGCVGIQPNQIIEVRILPRNGEFYAEYIYRQPTYQAAVDPGKVLGIDPGVNNWLTCVSNVGKSFIIDGHRLKSLNQFYNKRVAALKEGKPQGYWDDELATICEKRNRQMRDAINKAARFILNWCLANQIGTVVFGWNQGIKDGINIGSKNNQEFVQIPTARLRVRLAQLFEQYGINFVETEEANTSAASFLDGDSLPAHGEKPVGWKASGKRVHRGLYRSAKGWFVSADANGAANIMAKVAAQLGFSLAEVGRAVLTLPQRYDVFSDLKKSYREKSEEARLQPAS